ncbi:MAG: cytochrome P450 [bacterium]
MEPRAHSITAPPTRPIPRIRGGVPILGQALAFQRDPLGLLLPAWREHGALFQFRLGGRDFVLFAGPEAHDAYFHAPDDQLSAREGYRFTIPIFGQGVAYDVLPERMAEQLGFLAPLLKGAAMQSYARLMHAEIDDYTRLWGPEGELDLPTLTNELTVNIASRCLLGADIRANLHTEFARLYHDLEGGINTLGFFLPRLPTRAHRRRDRARREVAALMSRILVERRRSGSRPEDFMQALLEARYGDGCVLSDEEITGLLLTALFAGQHTSAVLAAWVGIELLQHREYLAQVLAEIEIVYGRGEGLSLDTLKVQSVLERAVREGERLHPPLIVLVRKVLRAFEYQEFHISAGTMAMVSPLLSHRLPTVFKDPERYDPDRFAMPREEHKQAAHALIGFGGGRHRCLGMHFAYMQIEALWSVLLSRFEWDLLSPPPAPDYGSWVTGPRAPCRVRYRRRSGSLGSRL